MTDPNPTAPQYPYQPPPPAPKKRHTWRNIILGTLGVMTLVVVIAAVAAGGGSKTPASSSASTVTDVNGEHCSVTRLSANDLCPGDRITSAPYTGPTAPPSAVPTTSPPPQYTESEQQAIDSAQSYLSAEPGFSYLGLIGQLDSSAVGFSEADATFGVSTVAPAADTAFWDAQAAASAKDYMSTEPGWSACGLVGQLDSDAVQFTQAQAEYGAQSVGLGTC